jgi:UDP-N-acetylmuramoyl-tripeptide--D-alanyl-D-alanine ligase
VVNALAAAAVGLWLGGEPEAVARSLAEPPASRWRMELARTAEGMAVLNDAYNAGPASMAAALRSLAALPAQRRIAVLGTMAELGDRAAEEHERIAELAGSLGIEVLAVGTDLYGPGLHGAAPAADAAAAAEMLEGLLDGSDPAAAAVLVKGSRVAGLDLVAESLLA